MDCNKKCLSCPLPDCSCNKVYSEKSLYKNRPEAQKQRMREYARKKRDEARSKGLCIICRKKAATHGTKCYECYLRQKRYDKRKNNHLREHWRENGLCWYCGSSAIQGKRTCQKHYQILKDNIYTHCLESPKTKLAQREFTQQARRMTFNEKYTEI